MIKKYEKTGKMSPEWSSSWMMIWNRAPPCSRNQAWHRHRLKSLNSRLHFDKRIYVSASLWLWRVYNRDCTFSCSRSSSSRRKHSDYRDYSGPRTTRSGPRILQGRESLILFCVKKNYFLKLLNLMPRWTRFSHSGQGNPIERRRNAYRSVSKKQGLPSTATTDLMKRSAAIALICIVHL